jgi:hypothetical protein
VTWPRSVTLAVNSRIAFLICIASD